jgi:hypothetical protein
MDPINDCGDDRTDDQEKSRREQEKRESITSYQVNDIERGGGQVTQQATITITETQVEYIDGSGTVSGADPIRISASAENTGDAPLQYTQDELKTMSNIAQNIVEVSKQEHFDPTIMLGLARTETHMGMLQSHEASLAKQSDVNPTQLSGTSGITPTTDLRGFVARI